MLELQHQLLPNLSCYNKLLADVDNLSFSGFCLCAIFIQTEILLRWRMVGFPLTDQESGRSKIQRALPAGVCNYRLPLTELNNRAQHPEIKPFKIGVLNIPIIEKGSNCYKR